MNNITSKTALNEKETRAVHIMQLLGDKTRYKIFKMLMSKNELCVSDIANKLDISVSAVSQHFRSFELVGIVNKNRMGQKICYSIKENDKFIKQIAIITKGE